MIESGTRAVARRVLMVDDELQGSATAGSRAVRALADDMRARRLEVIEAFSYEDGLATVTSDAAIHGIFVNWSLGSDDKKSHKKATDLLRTIRKRNAKVPIFLMADRALAGTITIEIATIADEFVWILEDTSAFVGGRAAAAVERYVAALLPPFAKALAGYDRDREYSWAAPGHQGGVAFLKSTVGRAFFDFYGENLFRTDMGIERGSRPHRAHRRERALRRARVRRAPLVLRAQRHVGLQPLDHVGVRGR
jgi:arginine decarboxylase